MPTAAALYGMPTLCVSQACDLKIELRGEVRVWLSRCGLDDGEPFARTIYIELFDADQGRWVDVGHYDGDDPPRGLPGITALMLRGECR